jgi:hypothetical protein
MNYLLLVLVGLARFVPHAMNVTPIGATALFAGATCPPRIAWLVPLVPLFLGDALIGFYDPIVMVAVYIGFALSALIGYLLLSRKRSPARYASAVVSAALVFYAVSNFGIWSAGMYPPTAAGLLTCYVAGLPFLGASLLGDTCYTIILFGAQALALRLRPASAAAA